MLDSSTLQPVIEYVQANRAQWGAEQLRDRLLADGVSPLLVQAALAHVYGPAAPPMSSLVPAIALTDARGENEQIEMMVGYIRQYTGQYDPAALRARLLEASGSPRQVDLAFAKVFGYSMPPMQRTTFQPTLPSEPPKPMGVTGVALITFATNIIVLYYHSTMVDLIAMFGSRPSSAPIIGLIIVINLIVMAVLYRRDQIAWVKGMALGLVIALGIGGLILLVDATIREAIYGGVDMWLASIVLIARLKGD